MAWFERLARWLAGDDAGADGGVEALDRLLSRLEHGCAEARAALCAAVAARREADRVLARLADEEASRENAARDAIVRNREADAKRHLVGQKRAAAEIREFAAEVEARRRACERLRLRVEELEDIMAQVRVRRETRLARRQLRDANLRVARALENDGTGLIRGWNRLEAALENGFARLSGFGDPEDAAVGGLSAHEAAPEPGRPPVADAGDLSRALDADGDGDAVEARLRRLREELRAGASWAPGEAGALSDEAELDRLLDDLGKP